MMQTTIYDAKGRDVGFIREQVYYTTRDYKRGQIFKKPEYDSGMAVDEFILDQLEKAKTYAIVFHVVHFEPLSFDCIIALDAFLGDSRRINFDNINKEQSGADIKLAGFKGQRMLGMGKMIRAYGTKGIGLTLAALRGEIVGREKQAALNRAAGQTALV